MKLERLDLTAFGRLREVSVEFGPEVTVIVGENEAGKSTIHRAIRTALYGIDAGGQGRPAERSDWQRWMPWNPGPYGLALTYRLGDGRRIRVSHRLDRNPAQIQVHEIGGGDITDDLRVGRTVAPGRHHLGIDEAVFCATAWLGEDGLRLDSPDGAPSRASQLQEALERVADSGRGVTSKQAIDRLTAALDRIGTERRAKSPLGEAVCRLRELENTIEDARQRLHAVARDEDRLRTLDQAAAQTEHHRQTSERTWLIGRLAAIAAQRREIAEAGAEIARFEVAVAETAEFATFPAGDEGRILSLKGELHQATLTAEEAQRRWDAVAEEFHDVCARRDEIAHALEALQSSARVDPELLAAARALRNTLDAEPPVGRLYDELLAAEAHEAALRHEVAATGLGSLPAGASGLVKPLLNAARGSPSGHLLTQAASAATVIGVAGAVVALLGHRTGFAIGMGLVAIVATLFVAASGRWRSDEAAEARRQLSRMCAGLDLSDAGVARAVAQLPVFETLQHELQRQESATRNRRDEIERLGERAAILSTQADALVARLDVRVDVPAPRPPARPHGNGDADTLITQARRSLDAIIRAAEEGLRAAELAEEDDRSDRTERSLRALGVEADRQRAVRERIEATLSRLLANARISMAGGAENAIATFQEHCERRRCHERASAELTNARRRVEAVGTTDAHLESSARQLGDELIRRGGDPTAAAASRPLGRAELQTLEDEVEASRNSANAATAEATTLRARLAGQLDGLPSLADLEDERSRYAEARDHHRHQRAALERAITLIEGATDAVHRELAPRLARSVEARLASLTDGRYREVNIDRHHFAVSLLGGERAPELVSLELASHGTRDQVALLLRLALVDVLSDNGECAPLLLDEPMLSADPVRRAVGLEFLDAVSRTHQVVLTTSDPAMAAAICATTTAARVVELPSPRLTVHLPGHLMEHRGAEPAARLAQPLSVPAPPPAPRRRDRRV